MNDLDIINVRVQLRRCLVALGLIASTKIPEDDAECRQVLLALVVKAQEVVSG